MRSFAVTNFFGFYKLRHPGFTLDKTIIWVHFNTMIVLCIKILRFEFLLLYLSFIFPCSMLYIYFYILVIKMGDIPLIQLCIDLSTITKSMSY